MKEEVLEIIAETFEVDIEDLDLNTSLVDDLEADSIQLMELVMLLEDEYDIEIDEEAISSIDTIGDVIDYIESL